MTPTVTAPLVSLQEILIADDLSDASEKAIGYAKAIARRFDSRLLLVHVTPPANPVTIPEGEWFDDEPIKIAEQLESRGAALREEGLRAITEDAPGTVQGEVSRLADRHHSELLIFGTHGRLGWERFLLGSQAEQAATEIGFPVMGVGPKCPPAPAGRWQPRNILCVATPSAHCEAAVIYACQLAKIYSATVSIISPAKTDSTSTAQDWKNFEAGIAEKYPEAHLCNVLPHHAVAPAEVVASVLRDVTWRPDDVIVISATPGVPFAEHFKRGPLAHLLAAAPCPVISVPAKWLTRAE